MDIDSLFYLRMVVVIDIILQKSDLGPFEVDHDR